MMNRDEQRSRPAALPPRLHPCGKLRALYPSEQGGGTWIGVNDAGLCAALLNWYSMHGIAGRAAFSRGLIIPTLLAAKKIDEALILLNSLPLSKLDPFRLFLVHEGDREITSVSSDGVDLVAVSLPWERSHWFSSGFDEKTATRIRSETSEAASGESDVDSLAWLRRLHRSHHPEQGPFSICMHREDACTVSMTEVNLLHEKATLIYHAGLPCQAPDGLNLSLPIKR